MIEIYRTFRFEAAHQLPAVPEGHRCAQLHGHSYGITLGVRGEPDGSTGWLIDFGDIAEAFRPARELLDHRLLNEVEGLENPTSEVLARWIFDKVKPTLTQLSFVEVKETAVSGCIYRDDAI